MIYPNLRQQRPISMIKNEKKVEVEAKTKGTIEVIIIIDTVIVEIIIIVIAIVTATDTAIVSISMMLNRAERGKILLVVALLAVVHQANLIRKIKAIT
jgi:hypothetical protein